MASIRQHQMLQQQQHQQARQALMAQQAIQANMQNGVNGIPLGMPLSPSHIQQLRSTGRIGP
ncbi:hypothetical protein E4U13_000277 [Claviceps humidiphila]